LLACFFIYSLIPLKMYEGKLSQYSFLSNDNFMSLKVHFRNPFMLNLVEFFVILYPVKCCQRQPIEDGFNRANPVKYRRLNGNAIIQQGERSRTLQSVRRSREISFLKLVGFVYHPGRSWGIPKLLIIQLSYFISLFLRVLIAHCVSIKNKIRRFVYERCRVLASSLFINNCNNATKIKGGTYVEKFV